MEIRIRSCKWSDTQGNNVSISKDVAQGFINTLPSVSGIHPIVARHGIGDLYPSNHMILSGCYGVSKQRLLRHDRRHVSVRVCG